MRNALITIATFVVIAVIAYVALEAVAAFAEASAPSSTSGFNYGARFTGPLARDLAPWLAIIIAALGPLVALRNAVDRGGRRRR